MAYPKLLFMPNQKLSTSSCPTHSAIVPNTIATWMASNEVKLWGVYGTETLGTLFSTLMHHMWDTHFTYRTHLAVYIIVCKEWCRVASIVHTDASFCMWNVKVASPPGLSQHSFFRRTKATNAAKDVILQVMNTAKAKAHHLLFCVTSQLQQLTKQFFLEFLMLYKHLHTTLCHEIAPIKVFALQPIFHTQTKIVKIWTNFWSLQFYESWLPIEGITRALKRLKASSPPVTTLIIFNLWDINIASVVLLDLICLP